MRYAKSTSAPVSTPDSPDLPREHVTVDAPTADELSSLGPSAFEGTGNPYLAKVFGMSSTEIRDLSLGEPLATVDSYILALVKERNWVDNADSYQRVLAELKSNLGIDPSIMPLIALERLAKGVGLLRLQNMHKRRDQEIQNAISRLNKT